MGSDWIEDPSVTDGVYPGHRYNGEIPCINCNDVFGWACADAEVITEDTLPDFQQAIDDCFGDLNVASMLYVARRRQERPQGAMYSYIPKHLWSLFDACGPERAIGLGNPYKPGER